jgi:hypothetical protein
MNEYCAGLTVRDGYGYTPSMTALKEADLRIIQQPEMLRVLTEMVRHAPESIRVVSRAMDTALSLACTFCPHPSLVSLLLKHWTIAVCKCSFNSWENFFEELPCEVLLSTRDASLDDNDLIEAEKRR